MATRSTITENKKSAEKVAGENKIENSANSTSVNNPNIVQELQEASSKRKKTATLFTWDGHPLTANEANFIDEYVKLGNGMQSYLNAYPNSNAKCARQNANRLLSKGYITSEINHRLEQARTSSIASAQEIMQYFTDVMTGKIKDAFGLEASLAERTKAAVELAKRQIDMPQKLANNEPPELKITLDFARPVAMQTVGDIMSTTNPAEGEEVDPADIDKDTEGSDE